jgi:Flp pilus assembly protein protease CpaA
VDLAILLYTARHDAISRKIPDLAVGLLAAAAAIRFAGLAPADAALRAALALALTVLLCFQRISGGFIMGDGDFKLFTVTALLYPAAQFVRLLRIALILGAVGGLGDIAAGRAQGYRRQIPLAPMVFMAAVTVKILPLTHSPFPWSLSKLLL